EPHELMRDEADQGGVLEADLPPAGFHEARQGPQARRLAGAVRADETDDRTLGDLEGQALDRLDRAVADPQISDLKHARAPLPGRLPPPRGSRSPRSAFPL